LKKKEIESYLLYFKSFEFGTFLFERGNIAFEVIPKNKARKYK